MPETSLLQDAWGQTAPLGKPREYSPSRSPGPGLSRGMFASVKGCYNHCAAPTAYASVPGGADWRTAGAKPPRGTAGYCRHQAPRYAAGGAPLSRGLALAGAAGERPAHYPFQLLQVEGFGEVGKGAGQPRRGGSLGAPMGAHQDDGKASRDRFEALTCSSRPYPGGGGPGGQPRHSTHDPQQGRSSLTYTYELNATTNTRAPRLMPLRLMLCWC